MKNGETFNLNDLAQHFHDAESARQFLERSRWPEGPVCPHCGVIGNAYKLEGKADSKKPVRKGVYKCGGCSEQFTVTIGTIFEDSHIPLNKWLLAIHLLCASKKGMSAHRLAGEKGWALLTCDRQERNAPVLQRSRATICCYNHGKREDCGHECSRFCPSVS